MAYQKDYTTTYTINGREYTVTAPALFDSNTNELLPNKKPDEEAINDFNIVSQDREISELLSKINEDYIDYTAARLSKITHQPGSPWSMTQ